MLDQFEIWIPLLGSIATLIWGLRLISRVVRAAGGDPAAQSLLAQALSEKSADGERLSFSRVSGAIGAVALAASFVGVGLWLPFALGAADGTQITRLADLSGYFLGGGALFAPYAFNQLSRIFSGSTTS